MKSFFEKLIYRGDLSFTHSIDMDPQDTSKHLFLRLVNCRDHLDGGEFEEKEDHLCLHV